MEQLFNYLQTNEPVYESDIINDTEDEATLNQLLARGMVYLEPVSDNYGHEDALIRINADQQYAEYQQQLAELNNELNKRKAS